MLKVVSGPAPCQKKVCCKNCVRWYLTGADQCDIPNPGIDGYSHHRVAALAKATGIVEKEPQVHTARLAFLSSHREVYPGGVEIWPPIKSLKSGHIYGHPSTLNKDNDCVFYKGLPRPLRFLTGFFRMFH